MKVFIAEKTCAKCGYDLFRHVRRSKKRNMNETGTAWEEKYYYVNTCDKCEHREYEDITDWRQAKIIS